MRHRLVTHLLIRLRAARRAVLVVLALLGGCALGGTITDHAIAYNGTVQTTTDTVLVLNVLRARDRAPLHFTAFGGIRGALSIAAGLGYDLLGDTGVVPSLTGSSSPGFDVSPLDRQEFARGLLRPLDPALFRLLSDRGLPDQLLLHLLVSRFENGPGGRTVVNDPQLRQPLDAPSRAACAAAGVAARPPCDPFQAVVDRLTAHGRLLFNGYTRLVPLGPRLTRAEAAKPELLAAVREAGVTLRPDGPGWRLYRAVPQLVVCVPEPHSGGGPRRYTALALDSDAPQVSGIAPDGDPCTADEVVDRPVAAGRAAAPGMSWYLRSVEEVLQYLGAVQRREEAGVPYRITVGLDAVRTANPHLFRLWPERPAQSRLAVTYRGTRWWVAEQDDAEDLTLSVLALTTQLLNLQKSAGEIPSSGTLRLVR